MERGRPLLLMFALLCVTASRANAQQQDNFSTEGTVTNPVALPAAVWNVLARDRSVHELMSDEDGPSPKREWFTSSLMHSSTNRPLYIIVGKGPMMGAHSTHFWLISGDGASAHIVLRAFGDALAFRKSVHHGLRDVLVSYSWTKGVANVQYVSNGSRYVKTRAWTDKVD